MTDAAKILSLEPHGADAFVGESPAYEWGRIYGGLVIAQSLCAAMRTVDIEGHHVHSLHAYFILGGDPNEPVRYEVDRLRNGRSFTTRRVVARQSGGAILNLSCSFQRDEDGPDVSTSAMPTDIKPPEDSEKIDWGIGVDARLEHESTSPARHRVWNPTRAFATTSTRERAKLHKSCGAATSNAWWRCNCWNRASSSRWLRSSV